jgi:hypothetical protein
MSGVKIEEAFAREILRQVLKDHFDFPLEPANDEQPAIVYEAESLNGLGKFRFEYAPLDAVIRIVKDCERIFEEASLVGISKGEMIEHTALGERVWNPDLREKLIKDMAYVATFVLLDTLGSRSSNALQDDFYDSLIVAGAGLSNFFAGRLKTDRTGVIADARLHIEDAVEKAAFQRRETLVDLLSRFSHLTVVKGRGGSEPDVVATDEQCKKMATDYPSLHKHWKQVSNIRKSNGDWRAYAQAVHSDTPDDLLDRLNDLDPYLSRPSAIAHEHAARRCGIETNGCSQSTLGRLKRRGEQLLTVNQTSRLTERENGDS